LKAFGKVSNHRFSDYGFEVSIGIRMEASMSKKKIKKASFAIVQVNPTYYVTAPRRKIVLNLLSGELVP
jgi:hypothetical protein